MGFHMELMARFRTGCRFACAAGATVSSALCSFQFPQGRRWPEHQAIAPSRTGVPTLASPAFFVAALGRSFGSHHQSFLHTHCDNHGRICCPFQWKHRTLKPTESPVNSSSFRPIRTTPTKSTYNYHIQTFF